MVLKTRLRLQKGDRDKIRDKMNEFSRQRREKQPLELPSAGSIFKRPEGYYAGKLIQDCGLRGFRMGGAEVSGLHCGFIVNTGTATAADVEALIKHIQKTILNRFGVELQTEVKIIGEEP
jgi:UDP-N-acetylmuramate dehydrogenase